MAGPLLGILGKAVGAMLASQVGSGLGALAGEVLTASDIGLPLGARRQGRAAAGQRRDVRRGPRRHRGRRTALPRAARGRPPAAVRPRAVAARAPDRRGDRLRPRHRDQHRGHPEPDRGADARHRPDQPRVDAGAARGRAVRPPEVPRAGGRARSGSRSPSRWSRAGSTRSSARPPSSGCRPRPSSRRPYAAAAPPAVRPSRPSPRWSASSCGRAGCATPRPCGARCAPGRAPRPATACGCTPTCCRPPPTSTTRSASARTPPRPTSLSDEDFDAALKDLLDGDGPAGLDDDGTRSDPPRRRARRADGVAAADAAQAALRDRYVAHLARARRRADPRRAAPTT